MMTWIKRDNPVLQVVGWVWGWQAHNIKLCSVKKLLKLEEKEEEEKKKKEEEEEEEEEDINKCVTVLWPIPHDKQD